MDVSIPSAHLDAFTELARTLHFSRAAQALHITQSALSQRIQKLEAELGTVLLVRGRGGVQLTETGERLLRYCHLKNRLEEEATGFLKTPHNRELAGMVRLAAYSSVLRSVILPALAPLFRENSRLRCELKSYEVGDLPGVLQRGQADFAILDHPWEHANVEVVSLGEEEYVAIESKKHKTSETHFLDNDSADVVTQTFFRAESRKGPPLERSFLGDGYAILDGVRLGLGRAVMPRHLVRNDKSIRILPSFKSYKTGVYLHYYRQSFYSLLHEAVRKALLDCCPIELR
jgi:DNA-binding transcriptional LysR family regulator